MYITEMHFKQYETDQYVLMNELVNVSTQLYNKILF